METFEGVRESLSSLREAVQIGLESVGKAAGMLRNGDQSKALVTACDNLREEMAGLETYVEGRISHLQGMIDAAKVRKERIALKNSRYEETIQRLMESQKAFREKLKALPPAAKVVSRKPKLKKNSPKAPSLLPPQELRDQIARKIERPPAPPQTTGNIWENWGKNPQPPIPPHAEEEGRP